MKYLKLWPVVVILAFTIAMTSCQMLPSQTGLNATEVLLRRDVRAMFPPIKPSNGDTLTYGTACQIVEYNATVFCEFPETAPAEFPQSLCKPGAQVCAEVLGTPQTQPEPTPLPPRTGA